MKIFIGISGKRYIEAGERATVTLALQKYIDGILEKHHTTEFTGISALASGADSIFADLVLDHYQKPLMAILPFDADEYKKDFTNDADLKKLEQQLAAASQTTTLYNGVPVDEHQRNDRYFDAGKAIVDKTENVVFVWDGLPPAGEGGTADVMGYYTARHKDAEINTIQVSPKKRDEILDQLAAEYKIADEKAIAARNNHTIVWRSTLIFGCTAVIVFAAGIGFDAKAGWALLCSGVELLFIALAWGFIMVAKHKKFHKNYLSQRILAEKLRILKASYQIGAIIKLSTVTDARDEKIGHLIKAINRSVVKMHYRSVWFADHILKELIGKQRNYHNGIIKKIGEKHKFGEIFNTCIGILLFVVMVADFVISLKEYNTVHHIADQHGLTLVQVLKFMSIVLPGIYAVIEGWLFFENWEVTKKFSSKVLANLDDCQATLPMLLKAADLEPCRDEQNRSLQLLTNIMLTDNNNWQTIIEDKANYHWVF